ncbi:hypothetical protein LTR53_011413 [Teratosphaeriaceae sp. CCFEE 6253]|nr:hypothetical protein LTR53_011413 [Teratosphaeriaceae sp. CCFEE 6253]
MIARQCLFQRTARPCLPPTRRHFHPTPSRRDDGLPNHYATLEVAANATPAEIKKQFYKLSKAHHPDLHPDDPTAAERFVKISEAHATLGSADKKALYDRDFRRAQPSPPGHHPTPTGSYSSASTHAGSRPASGLSRRRTQFRGPPPSFYRSGGWGEHGAKRGEAASSSSHSHEAQGQSHSGPTGPAAGTGPGGFAAGFDNDVRHFDQRGHYKTHSTIEQMRHRARRRARVQVDEEGDRGGASAGFTFVMICGILVGTFGITSVALGMGGVERSGRRAESRAG